MEAQQKTRILWADSRLCSPWALSVWVALKEKKVPCELRRLDLKAGEHRTDEYRAHAMNGKIPVFQDGDFWLSESLAILEYLEETFENPRLLPAEPKARARDREILSFLRSDFFELRRCMPFEGLFWPQPATPITPKAEEEIARLLALVTTRLTSNPSEPPTLADIELAFMLRRILFYDASRVPPEAASLRS